MRLGPPLTRSWMWTMARRYRVSAGRIPLSDSEFVGGFQRRAAAPADDRRTIPAGKRISHFFGTIRAVQRNRCGLGRGILRARRHEEQNCSTRHSAQARRSGEEMSLERNEIKIV